MSGGPEADGGKGWRVRIRPTEGHPAEITYGRWWKIDANPIRRVDNRIGVSQRMAVVGKSFMQGVIPCPAQPRKGRKDKL